MEAIAEAEVGCVGAVLTFPQFRREGHASNLMRQVAHIRQTADVGMLFCDADAHGSTSDSTGCACGPFVEGEIPDGVLMILGDDHRLSTIGAALDV